MNYSQAKRVVQARGIIQGLCAEARAKDPEIDLQGLRRYVRKRYPWKDRTGWKYRAWLIAAREVFGDRRKARKAEKFGQNDLFLEGKS